MLTQKLAQQRAADQIHTYEITLDLSKFQNPEVATFPSRSVLEVTPAASEIILDLAGENVRVTAADGTNLPFTHDDELLTISGVTPGQRQQITVEADCWYSRTGEGLHRYHDPEDDTYYLYTQYEPADAHRVYACYDQPDMKAVWNFKLITPPELVVLSNQPEASKTLTEDGGNGPLEIRIFAPTPPLSSYLTCVIVGPYAKVDGGTWAGTCQGQDLEIALGAYCRQSLLKYFDHEDVFEVTRAGLQFYHDRYLSPYPWGKYDQVFVPEYNLGAMENPGCVTFNEHFISRDGATFAHRQGRANTILHEMCHMWFGDLVTPRWWNDLWLKESFADHEGTHAVSCATQYSAEWASFALGRKSWAYSQDQLPTTHPILATIPDTAAAKLNFDGITYAKGASVLKQLRAYLGDHDFAAGARLYFARHAYGATTLNDFLAALQEASGRGDLGDWCQAWLNSTGPSVLTGTFISEAPAGVDGQAGEAVSSPDPVDETSAVFRITQTPAAPRDLEVRPHRFIVSQYENGQRVIREDVLLTEASITVPAVKPGRLTVINDEDLTYAVCRLDDDTLRLLPAELSKLEDVTTRAVIWSALVNGVRDGVLDPAYFLELVVRHLPVETDEPVAANVMEAAAMVAGNAVDTQSHPELLKPLFDLAWANVGTSLEWAQLAVDMCLYAKTGVENLRALLAGNLREVGPSLRWRALEVATALGADVSEEVARAQAEDKSGEAQVSALAVSYSAPDAETKARAWERLNTDLKLSNLQFIAIAAAFNRGGHAALTAPYMADFFAQVGSQWNQRSIQMGKLYTLRLFPLISGVGEAHGPAPYLQSGQWGSGHPVVEAAENWLKQNPEAPASLRRIIIERLDAEKRMLWVRSGRF